LQNPKCVIVKPSMHIDSTIIFFLIHFFLFFRFQFDLSHLVERQAFNFAYWRSLGSISIMLLKGFKSFSSRKWSFLKQSIWFINLKYGRRTPIFLAIISKCLESFSSLLKTRCTWWISLYKWKRNLLSQASKPLNKI
jgi:hypothetical protein